MNRSLLRPTAALFPLVLMAASLFGNNVAVNELFFYYCIIQLTSLCSIDSFRNAAAREPSPQGVDICFSGTWMIALTGIFLCAVAVYFMGWNENPIIMIAAAGCVVIEQLFEERMYAMNLPGDGVIMSVIANVLLFAGLMIDASAGIEAPVVMPGFFTVCGAALGMLISIVITYAIEPAYALSVVPVTVFFFPKAFVQAMLYPIAAIGLTVLFVHLEGEPIETARECNSACVFAGLISWRLSRTICRRASDESRPLNLLLVAICALLIVGGCYVEMLVPFGFFALVALLCAIIVYCAPSVRLYAAFVLLCAAWLLSGFREPMTLASIACAAVAVILNLHKAFLKKV